MAENILQIVQDSMRRAFEKDGKKVRIDIALQKNFIRTSITI